MPSLISGMAYVRLSAPDLGRMQAFLEDFGMVTVARDARRLYMRGIGDSPFLHVTELGDPGAAGFAYDLADPERLAEAAKLPGAGPVEPLDAPGGGERVRLRGPDGLGIELVAGRERVAPLPPRPLVRGPEGESRTTGPARIRRIAHTAYMSRNLPEVIDWYQRTLGVIPSDELFVGETGNTLGQFNRVDLGEEPVDHHVIFLLRGRKDGMHHVSYEVEGVDDIFFGFDHMAGAGRDHVRGIGRHALGSQIFNYWMSPFEQMHEHWISQERLTANSKFNLIRIGEGMSYDTGEKPSKRFVEQASPLVPPLP
ncbi:VOC family protein [Actinomadura montaniterrae]|uniref:Catechol 2,3-dioxygenase n=1 Tax=Actinomadura montaniterrae TaxID=1803903 RepID=A0A6L3VTX6_9ACTN|nr:VOC family protein [Actinomadura montaniterrae]KAB2381354.1 catechol 2,3-dioxygenase [Actinomadura montaniterrae]